MEGSKPKRKHAFKQIGLPVIEPENQWSQAIQIRTPTLRTEVDKLRSSGRQRRLHWLGRLNAVESAALGM